MLRSIGKKHEGVHLYFRNSRKLLPSTGLLPVAPLAKRLEVPQVESELGMRPTWFYVVYVDRRFELPLGGADLTI